MLKLYLIDCVPELIYVDTVRNTSMNPSFFGKFSLEVFELEISPISIFASSFQGLSDEQVKISLRPTKQLTVEKHDFEPFI